MSSETLVRLVQQGVLGDDSLIWREGLAQWQSLGTLRPELGLGSARPPAPPPIPMPVATHRAPAGARRGLSGCAIAAIISVACVIPVIAILAAIAIPAYQDYTTRAAVAQALAQATPVQAQVQAAIAQAPDGQCPENGQPPLRAAADYASGALASINIGRFENGNCGMELVLGPPKQPRLHGKRLWLERVEGNWACSSELPDKSLPAQCRAGAGPAPARPRP